MHVITLTYTADLSVIDELLPAHVDFLKAQYAAGNFLLSGRRAPRIGGVILSAVDDEETLWKILRQDPFHAAGAAEYELVRFTPSMARQELAFLKEA